MTPQFLEKFPDYCSLLLFGPPGVGKLDYMLDALVAFLQKRQKVLFVCVDVDPKEILEHLKRRGEDVSDHVGRSLLFIDCLTLSMTDERGEGQEGVIFVSSFSNLEGIGMAIAKGAESLAAPVKILLYSISTLFLYNSSQSLSKFAQIVSARVKTQMGLIMYACHEGVSEERQEELLKSLVDGVVEMKFGTSMERHVRLHHLRGHQLEVQWVPVGEEAKEIAAPGETWEVEGGGGDH